MHTKKTSEATITPANERFPLARRYQAQIPETGKNVSNAALFSAAMPQSSPNSIQSFSPSRSSRDSASQKIVASRSVERLVSHTQRVHQNTTFGSKAHAQAEPTATLSEKIRLAIKRIGIHVSAEKRLLMLSKTNADERV